MIDILIFLFKYVPDLVVHSLVLFGFVGLFISSFSVSTFSNFGIKMISIFILLVGLYLEGGLAVTKDYIEKQKMWTERINLAEQRALDINTRIEYIYVDRIKKVKEIKVVYKDRIQKSAKDIDSKCDISKDTVKSLNSFVRGIENE